MNNRYCAFETKILRCSNRDGYFNPTPGNVVKTRLLVMNRSLSGTPVQIVLEEYSDKNRSDYREIGIVLYRICMKKGVLSQCMDPYTFCNYIVHGLVNTLLSL